MTKPKILCRDCDHLSDYSHELDPLGQWKYCELHKKDVHEDTGTCDDWVEAVLVWPGETEGEG